MNEQLNSVGYSGPESGLTHLRQHLQIDCMNPIQNWNQAIKLSTLGLANLCPRPGVAVKEANYSLSLIRRGQPISIVKGSGHFEYSLESPTPCWAGANLVAEREGKIRP